MVVVLVVSGLSATSFNTGDSEGERERMMRLPAGLKVGAFYTLQSPEQFDSGYLRGMLDPPQGPVLGPYSSWKPEVPRKHISWASSYGLDFFALSYFPGASNDDQRFECFLEAPNIGDIEFCIFYRAAAVQGDPVTELQAVAKRFMNHPQYLKVHGRPLLVVSADAGVTDLVLEQARTKMKEDGYNVFLVGDRDSWEKSNHNFESFDGVTCYSLKPLSQHHGYVVSTSYLKDLWQVFLEQRRSPERPFFPCILPGYNDRASGFEDRGGVVPRDRFISKQGGSFRRNLNYWALPSVHRGSPIVFVRSWNEWHSDTAIEPCGDAPATNQDRSGRNVYTAGFPYHSYGMDHLKALRDCVIGVTGLVQSTSGLPAPGVSVSAWQGRTLVANATTNADGVYAFRRADLPLGTYRVGLTQENSVSLALQMDYCIKGVDFATPPRSDGSLRPKELKAR